MTPPSATVPAGTRSRPRFEGQNTDAVAELERLVQTGDLLPGRGLDPAGLAHLTGHTSTAMYYALQQLAFRGAVEAADGRWTVPDERSAQASARRAQKVLEAMIHQDAFPPGSVLPPTSDLSFTLLTDRRAMATALDDLVRHGTLDRADTSYAVPANPPHPGPSPWPEPAAFPARGRPRLPEVSKVPDRHAVRHLRDTARAQWETAERPPQRPGPARNPPARPPAPAHPGRRRPVRAACTRAQAAAGTPMATLGDRHWRYAVLATLPADLADELTRST